MRLENKVLNVLHFNGSASCEEISRQTVIKPQVLLKTINDLEYKGLLIKQDIDGIEEFFINGG